ncbi:MAG: dTMP kinase [Chlamydiota bacterium]
MTVSKKGNRQGLFITFEGGEGSGKTTVLKQVDAILKKEAIATTATREPGGTLLGEQIRALLLEKTEVPIAKRAELFLFLAARAQNVAEVIVPALEEQAVVLCDRFTDSTLAYQGNNSEMLQCCLVATAGLEPDLTLFFDIDPALGLKRARQAGKVSPDRMEQRALDFHLSVRTAFLQLAKQYPERFFTLDASLPLDTVVNHALEIIREALAKVSLG